MDCNFNKQPKGFSLLKKTTMKKYNNEEMEEKANLNDWPLYASDENQDERDREEEDEEETDEEEGGDWGDVDPAGGPEPSAPGSAV